MRTLDEPAELTEPAAPPPEPRSYRVLGYALLALLAYVPPLLTAPGKVAADTKQYLYLDPGRLMSRAVSMWDPNIGMGTVTHQNIGYLFPMGPFYWVFDKLGVPDWIAQRIWLGTLLLFAALGMLWLLRGFALRGPGVVVAALAYMLSPYILDYAARISVLLLPWAALPWMIGVLHKALRSPAAGEKRSRLDAWRYPAIFALIVQVVGGVNATALLFAGFGAALWILYAWLIAREVTFRRALGVTVRTGVLTLLTSLWWIAGLRMQAAYGLDVLRYTETIDAVARTSSPNEVLRGLGYWFFYGQDRLGPWIESASDYTQHLWVILAGYSLVALAFLSAAFVRWKHRAYFVLLLVVGVIIAVGANPYAHPTPLGALFKSLASSSTAALAMRSTARAVPLVVCAIAIFLGLGTNVVRDRFQRRGRTALAFATPVVVVGLILLNFPAIYDGSFYGKNLERPSEIPAYWTQAIAALSARGNQTRILEVPGADFASYTWGNTVDPITPGLTDRPYVARELIPYGTAGSADLLNAIDRRIQEGVADPAGLVALWRRMGIGDVVARNDIQWQRYDLVQPRVLAQLLAGTPGLGAPTSYGPATDFGTVGYQDEVTLAARPADRLQSPVVVYPVNNPLPIVRAESADHALMVSGDGEGLADAADAGLLDGAGVVQYSASYPNVDALRRATTPGAVLVITDNNRLRARRWTSVKDNVGFTEQAGEADATLVHDTGDARLPLFPGEPASAYTTTIDEGIQRATVSSYGNTITYTPEYRAAMALDGDLATAWRANAYGDARGQRIRIDLDGEITTDHVNLVQQLTGGHNRWISDISLRFDGKDTVHAALGDASHGAAGQTVTFPSRTFHTVEITVDATTDLRTNLFGTADAVGFAEIRLRDQHANRDVQAHEIEQMPTDVVDALGAGVGEHPLVFVMRREAVRPVPPRAQPELSIDRRFVVPTARSFALTGNATISTDAPSAALQSVFDPTSGVTVTASAYLPGCVQCRPAAAFDGDPRTAWETPFIDVRGQYVEVTNAKALSFDHVDLRVLVDGRHSVPTRVRLDVDGQTRELRLPALADQPAENASANVHLTFPRVSGKKVRLTIEDVREEQSLRFATTATALMPVGVAELGIPGLLAATVSAEVRSGCRADLVRIDDRPVPVRITGPSMSSGGVMGLTVTSCDPKQPGRAPLLALSAGPHVLTTARGKDVGWSVERLVLASGTESAPVVVADGHVTEVGAPAPAPPQVTVTHDGRTSLRAHVTGATQPFWMVLGQSQSKGWRAHVVGEKGLGDSQLVDGYANGWLVTPTSSSFDIAMDWAPQRQVDAALWISLLAALASLAIIAITWRRRALVGADEGADAAIGVRLVFGRQLPTRVRWIAPVLAGLLAALAVAPWVGLVVAALVALIVFRPRARIVVMLIPAALVLAGGLYLAAQQFRYRYPPVFEWPTLFTRARTPAWIAVMLLAGDVIVEIVRTRTRDRPDDP